MTLMARLLAARQRAGLTQQQVADKAGLTQPGYARLEKGKVQSTTYIAQLAQALGVSSVWLATGSGSMEIDGGSAVKEPRSDYTGVETKVLATPSELGDLSQSGMSRRRLPLLSYELGKDFRTALKKWRDGLPQAETDIDLELAKELCMDAFALVVEGISMEPEFRAGDILIIDPSIPPRAGCFVFAVTEADQTAHIRKYRERGRNAEKQAVFELVPTNNDFATIQVTDGVDGCIIGVVIEHRRKLI